MLVCNRAVFFFLQDVTNMMETCYGQMGSLFRSGKLNCFHRFLLIHRPERKPEEVAIRCTDSPLRIVDTSWWKCPKIFQSEFILFCSDGFSCRLLALANPTWLLSN